MINKTLVKNLHLGTLEETVGSELKKDGRKHTVVGVFDDFYSNSLKESVDNMVMEMNPSFYRVASIKLNTLKRRDLPWCHQTN